MVHKMDEDVTETKTVDVDIEEFQKLLEEKERTISEQGEKIARLQDELQTLKKERDELLKKVSNISLEQQNDR